MRSTIAKGMICAALLLSACGAHTKRELLTFFFDGVPPEKAERPAGAGPPPGTTAPRGMPPPASPAAKAAPEKIVHRPYGERRCDACHESQFSQKLRGKTGEICQLCHKNLFAGVKFRHAPAEDGSCLGCHNPHESAEKFLLARKGRKVCLDCHDSPSSSSHERAGETACQACHGPHGGGDRFFLKAEGARAPAEDSVPAAR